MQQASSSHIHPKYLLKIFVKIFIQIFDEYFGSHPKFLVAEAVMRKRNELEKLKMLRQDEERRREELVGEQMKILTRDINKSRHFLFARQYDLK